MRACVTLGAYPKQAAEAGDAGKVDKRRKKQKADAAEADLFADGGEAGGDDDEDAEYDGDASRSRLAGTGATPRACMTQVECGSVQTDSEAS